MDRHQFPHTSQSAPADEPVHTTQIVRREEAGLADLAPLPPHTGCLSAVVSAWCLALIAGWLPHYLTLPLHADSDHFAMLAQLWDSAGKVPYRDIFSTQFPGEIYLYWILGKLFGWGNIVAFRAVDAGMLFSFFALMIAWSRRRFRTALPGLIGASSFLVFYLDQNYTMTGQRDWHAAFYAASGLILLLGCPERAARLLSAVAYAFAVITRPQFALIAPAFILAIQDPTRDSPQRSGRGWSAVFEWTLTSAGVIVLGFTPLFAAGAFDDFLRSLRAIAYGSQYNRASPLSIVARLFSQSSSRLGVLVIPASILVLTLRAEAGRRNASWALLAALSGLFLYAPISPVYFPYLQFPLETFLAVAACFLAGMLLTVEAGGAVRVVAVLLLFSLVGLKKPEFVTFRGHYEDRVAQFYGKAYILKRKEYGVLEALRILKSGELPTGNPPGFRDTQRPYAWDELRGLILYLRANTSENTPVANLLMDCAAAINSVVPRLSPMPADQFSLASYPDFAMAGCLKAIEETESVVVVWSPSTVEEEFPRFAPIWKAIRDRYRPDAKFGLLEVWRRR